ncbi:MAG: hypothetical protein J5597_05975 [Spirochaetaceae bacterium]|nr:hypothetical protein [Spirochaetaceae bacterium]
MATSSLYKTSSLRTWEETDKNTDLTPITESSRSNWAETFNSMHQNHEDVFEEIPDSLNFEWEW